MSDAERAGLRRRHPDCQLCWRRPSTAVDHDARTGLVRGVVCRSCNSWLGSMEAALRVPERLMQNQAAYLHWRFEVGGTTELAARYRGELSYLDMTPAQYAEGLRRLIPLPYVYWRPWTGSGPVSRAAVDEDRPVAGRRGGGPPPSAAPRGRAPAGGGDDP
ncbi:endonuclease domain-containing protein [Streptomyces sp. NPDC096136]|uniref:endonuclease domain-containing protein n=1 Tax=Streptomyces sp. NPDC096136 TaxID=3366076 RepID=UPI0037F57816